MRKILLPLIAVSLLALSLLTGCASIVDGGKTKTVHISTVPSGVNITIIDNHNGETVFTGTSPTDVALARSAGYFQGVSYSVKLSKEGYKDKTMQINSSVNGWYIGNIVFGGLIGWIIVDPVTGAMYSLPSTAAATLEANSSASLIKDAKAHDLIIADINSIPEDMRASLVAIQ